MFKCNTAYKKVMGIYRINNISNDKFYIGSAVDLYDRFLHHRKRLRGNSHNNKHLQRAFNKYGENSFIFEVVEIVSNKNSLLEIEQHWLDETQCYNSDIGYNLSKNATAPMLGMVFTEEHRGNLSKALKGKQQPDGFKERMSKLHKGKKLSEEHKEKLLKANEKYWTEENKEKHSKISRDRWDNDKEFRKKALANLKVEMTEEGRKNISNAKKGEKHHNAKLTEEEVKEIKVMLRDKISRKTISEQFNVSAGNLSKIAIGERWSHVKI